ncbi:hypothetical protein EC991_007645 [Linnemannia zychae]|nr:hypothetical protein EC991_007645 [Linnemannia zychae]
MTTLETHSNVQAVRRVDENGCPPTISNIIHLVCHSDPEASRDIILWDDVCAAFDNTALHVRSGTLVLPFLKGPDFKNFEPLRIAAVPGSTLDVVVRGHMNEMDQSTQENNVGSMDSNSRGSTATVRRNPAYGLVEEAMDAYRNNENPAFAPQPRGPQAILDDLPPTPTSNISPAPQESDYLQSLPLQESASATNNDVEESIERVKLGDREAQYALGDMYRDAQGVPQNYQAAMDWYLKAPDQGHPNGHIDMGYQHNNGLGAPQGDAEAIEWQQEAANQGSSSAQLDFATRDESAEAVAKDKAKATKWYKKAADKGQAEAKRLKKRHLAGKLFH